MSSQSGHNNPNWKDAKETSICNDCGEPFSYYPSNKNGKICSICSSDDWSESEIEILREVYPNGGSKAVSDIVGRSRDAVRGKASILGISTSYIHHPDITEDLPIELECGECEDIYEYDGVNQTMRDICFGCYQRKKRHERKRYLVDKKGGKCEICGYSDCLRALCFHHVDPNEKEFQISKNNVLRSFEKIEEEAEKCVLLCSNCHSKHHCGRCYHESKTF